MRQKNGLFVFCGLFVLVLLLSGLAIAGGEPGVTEKILISPYIRGIVTITPSGESTVDATLLGVCKTGKKAEPIKRNFCGFDTGMEDFSAIGASDLLNFRLLNAGIQDCLTKCGYEEELIIFDVLRFRNNGSKIWADVIMKYVVPDCYPDC